MKGKTQALITMMVQDKTELFDDFRSRLYLFFQVLTTVA